MCVACHHAHMTTGAQETETWVPELTFGARLALIRHRMGWNIKEAAAACGLPAQSWRGWEVDGHLPRRYITIAMAIANRTGCDYLWLVHGPARGQQPTNRIGAVPPHEYLSGPVLVATVGEARLTGTTPRGRRPRLGKPVRQTRPLATKDSRPMTPVAV